MFIIYYIHPVKEYTAANNKITKSDLTFRKYLIKIKKADNQKLLNINAVNATEYYLYSDL